MQEPADALGSPLQGPPSPPALPDPPTASSIHMPPDSPVNPGFPVPPGPQGPPSALRRHRQERIVYTQEQKHELEEYFKNCPYPTYGARVALAERINVTDRQVQIWLKNRRANCPKDRQPGPALCSQGNVSLAVSAPALNTAASTPESAPDAPAATAEAPGTAPDAAPGTAEIAPAV